MLGIGLSMKLWNGGSVPPGILALWDRYTNTWWICWVPRHSSYTRSIFYCIRIAISMLLLYRFFWCRYQAEHCIPCKSTLLYRCWKFRICRYVAPRPRAPWPGFLWRGPSVYGDRWFCQRPPRVVSILKAIGPDC